MRKLLFSACAAALLACGATAAHPGGLNKEGCHNDRKNGGYHCHRAPRAPAQSYRPPSQQPNQLAPFGQPSRTDYQGRRTFANCDQARAAGAAPVRRGDPGYGPHLDRDNDGVGCEPFRGK